MPYNDPLSYMGSHDPLASYSPTTAPMLTVDLDKEAQNRRASMHAVAQILDNPDYTQSIFERYNQNFEKTSSMISTIGDHILREEARVKELQTNVEGLSQLARHSEETAQEDQVGAQLALQTYLQEKAVEEENAAAEKLWAENLQHMIDSGRDGEALLNQELRDNPDAFHNLMTIQSRRAMMMKAIEDSGAEIKDRNVMFHILDFLLMTIPTATSMAQTGNFEATSERWYDWLLSGERENIEANNLWYQSLRMNDSDAQKLFNRFAEDVRDQTTSGGYHNKLLMARILAEYNNTPSATETNLWATVDNSPLLFVAGNPMKAPFRLTRALTSFGGRNAARDLAAKTFKEMEKEGVDAVAKRSGVTLDEVEDSLAHPAVSGTATPHDPPSIAGTVNEAIGDLDEIMEEFIGDVIATERMSPEEQAVAIADAEEKAAKMFTTKRRKRHVEEITVDERQLGQGSVVKDVYALLGGYRRGEKGGLFSRKSDAEALLKETGMADAEVVQRPGNLFGVRVRIPVDEQGQTLENARILGTMQDKERAGALGGIARYLAGGRVTTSEDLIGLAAVSSDKRNRVLSIVNDRIIPTFSKLPKQDKELLLHSLTESTRQQKWFSNNELRVLYARQYGATKDPRKFIEGYRMARYANDLEYGLRNADEYVNLFTQGYETVTFGKIADSFLGQDVTAKVVRFTKGNSVPDEVIYNVGEGNVHVPRKLEGAKEGFDGLGRLDGKALNDWYDKGYVLIRTRDPIDVPLRGSRAKVRNFLVHRTDVQSHPLEMIQIPYKAGGHRMYSGKYPVKMAVTGTQPWGEDYFDTPYTPVIAHTRAEAEQWAKSMNELREIYRDAHKAGKEAGRHIDDIEEEVLDLLDAKIAGRQGLPSGEEAALIFRKYGTDHPFEAVFDRELPSIYSSGSARGNNVFDDDLSGLNTHIQTSRGMYYGKKGEQGLRSVQNWNEPAEVLDPFKILNTSLSNIAKLSGFTDYKIRSVNKWISTYGPALDLDGIANLHPMRIFLESKFKSGTKDLQAIKVAAETQRDNIKRMLGWKSDFDMGVENSTRRIIEAIAGNNPGKYNKFIHDSYEWWNDIRPVNSMRGMAFDMTMGFFNPGQLFLQVQTAFAAATISPRRAMGAMINIPAVTHFIRKSSKLRKAGKTKGIDYKEASLEYYVSRGFHKSAGFDNPQEYKAMMRAMDDSGFLEVKASHVLKEEYGPNAAMGNLGRNAQHLRRGARFFFDKAEQFNRAVAYQIAWREVRQNFPDLAIDSPKFLEKVRDRAGVFSFSMDEAGAAYWQKGTLGWPTQFMSYMARWHEMMFGKSLTPRQRIQFAVGQAMMYGTAGIPVVAAIDQMYSGANGEGADISELPGQMRRGFWDTLIWYGTGIDVAFSQRAGIGLFPTDIIREIFNMSRYGETSAVEVALGPTYQIFIKDLGGALGHTMKYALAENGYPDANYQMTYEGILQVARNISTVNSVMKAYAIMEYGNYTNRQGETRLRDLPSQTAFAALLGMQPGEALQLSAQMDWLANQQKHVDEISDLIVSKRQDLYDAIKNKDNERAEALTAQIHATMSMVPAEIREKALRKADAAEPSSAMYESIGTLVEEEEAAKRSYQINEEQR